MPTNRDPSRGPEPGAGRVAVDPGRVRQPEDLVAELDALRRRAAWGTSKARVGLAELAQRCGVPRSTVHTYVSGTRLPPADVLDRIVVALGADGAEQAAWADALDRLDRPDRPDPATHPEPSGPTGPTATPPAAVPRQLPPPPAVFVGRAAALAALDALAPGADRRLAVVTGGGGIGKSALVRQWAARAGDRFPDGQLHLELQGFGPLPPRTAADVLARLLRGLGVDPHEVPAGEPARADLLADSLAGRRLLVVLDNARDVAQVRSVLAVTASATGVVTVVTSRDDLAEAVVGLDAVRVPVGPLDADEVDLLVSLAVEDAADAGDVSALRVAMRRCAGLPLALRVVGERWRRGLTAPEEPRTPEERLDEVGLGAGALGVRTTLGWTLDQLDPVARRVFVRLGAVPQARVDVDLAAAAADATPRATRQALEALAAVHLVEPAPGGGFTRHDLVADFAAERHLAEDPEPERRAVADRVADHAARRAAGAAVRLGWPLPLDVDTHDQGAAGDPGVDLAWIERHLDLLAALGTGPTTPPWVRWVAASVLARYQFLHDPTLEVGPALDHAVTTARRARHDRALAVLENLRGIVSANAGHLDTAWRRFTVSLRRARRAGAAAAPDVVQGNLAKLAGRLGRHDQALAALHDLVARGGPGEADNRAHLAEVLFDLGDLDGAVEHATPLLEHTDVNLRTTAHHFLAQVEARHGHPDRARAVLARAPEPGPGIEPLVLVDRWYVELDVATAEGRLDDAAALGRRALRSRESADDVFGSCSALVTLAEVELAREDEAAAAVWLAEARVRADGVGLHHWTMIAMLHGARLSARLGDPAAALDELDELDALATRLGSTPVRTLSAALRTRLRVERDG